MKRSLLISGKRCNRCASEKQALDASQRHASAEFCLFDLRDAALGGKS
jgi:hypothetical protein